MSNWSIVYYDEGWAYMQKGIKKLLQGLPNPHFTSEDSLMLYTNVYNMCRQKPPHDYSKELYEQYNETFKDYIKSTVLPSLREKKDELLLRDLLKRWSNHKIMIEYLSFFFSDVDKKFTRIRQLPSLEKVGYLSFYSLVYDEMQRQVMKYQSKYIIIVSTGIVPNQIRVNWII
ncbi:unnamed protein product [Trifolium pratense]|uniref:Uncharacterized protein n=1 Tax=Trifolium pratense TaxID=57577 RepID=A0ACB0K9C6_TRIPR|nr:unnamed protein product [Trifolium pratense]